MFSGEGTEEAPYLIENEKDLEKLAELAVSEYDTYGGSCYRLTKNIKMKKGKNNHTPIGSAELPFIGAFDGSGYVISGLSIDKPRKEVQGLFGAIGEEGTVKNVGLTGNTICGRADVGSIAGINYGTIESCFQTGDIYGMENSAGGIAGRNSGTVESCYSTGLVCGGYKTGACIDTDFDGSNRKTAHRAGIRDFIMTVAETVAESIAETVSFIIEETKAGLETIYEIVTTAISPESGETDMPAGSLEEDISGPSEGDTMSPEDSIAELETEEKGPGYEPGETAFPPSVGGLVGINEGGAVTDSYQAGRQAAKKESWKVGGIAGVNADGLLDNCYYVQGAPAEGSEDLEYDGVLAVTSERITGIDAIELLGLDSGKWIGRQVDEEAQEPETNMISAAMDEPVRYRHYYPQLTVFEEKGQSWPYTLGLIEIDGLRVDTLSKRANVSTEEAWEWLFAGNEYLDYEIILEEDLNLNGFGTSIGTMEIPFTGILDGNGHVIRGITKPLFGVLGEGSAVYYLLIDEAEITALMYHGEDEYSQGADVCGVLAAYAQGSVIDSCGAVGNISLTHGNGKTAYVGGLIGEAAAGTSIYESYSFVNITEQLGQSAKAVCGGLAGKIGTDAGAVNSYATGRLECSGVTGGFAGENRGEIRDSFVTTIIAKTSRTAGAFVGYMPGEAEAVSMSIPERELLKAAAGGITETKEKIDSGARKNTLKDIGESNMRETSSIHLAGIIQKTNRVSQTEGMSQTGSGKETVEMSQIGSRKGSVGESQTGSGKETVRESQTGSAKETGGISQNGNVKETGGESQAGSVKEPVGESQAGSAKETGGTPQNGSAKETGGAVQNGNMEETRESSQTESTAGAAETLPSQTTDVFPAESTSTAAESDSGTTSGPGAIPAETENPATPSQTTKVVTIMEPETDLSGSQRLSEEEWIKANVTITGCAYDAQMSGCTDRYAEGLLTADMIGFDAVLPGGDWYMTEGAYPQLECMACHTHESYLLCSKASAIPLILPAGITLQDMPDGSEKAVSVSGSLEMGLPPQIDGDPIEWSGSGKVTIQEDGTALLD